MAVINYTNLRTLPAGTAWTFTWTNLATGDTGQPVEMTDAQDRSIQVSGTFGTSTFTLEGSNDGTNWFVLTDPQGNNISKTAAALEAISEAVRYVRPNVSGGAGATLTAVLFVKGQQF